jgi:hypothetical protein
MNVLQMFGAMFGAAMFGDGDEDDFNEIFMGEARIIHKPWCACSLICQRQVGRDHFSIPLFWILKTRRISLKSLWQLILSRSSKIILIQDILGHLCFHHAQVSTKKWRCTLDGKEFSTKNIMRVHFQKR